LFVIGNGVAFGLGCGARASGQCGACVMLPVRSLEICAVAVAATMCCTYK